MAIRDLRSRTQPQPAAQDEAAPRTYIDAGCELSGTLRFADDVRIDGRIEGEIDAAKSVSVGESAQIRAGLRAESIEVHGSIEGDLHVRRKTVLYKSARVSGEIHTAGIVVEEGARLRGTIVIGDGDAPADEPGPSPKTSNADGS